jgi:hypothetical protein
MSSRIVAIDALLKCMNFGSGAFCLCPKLWRHLALPNASELHGDRFSMKEVIFFDFNNVFKR